MTRPDLLNPHPPEFERFLHASVGEDRNGAVVTVLSTLARLGLDPWAETAELVALGREAARARLGALLARARDVPALANDHGRIARDLSRLLPNRPPAGAATVAPATWAGGPTATSGLIWAALAIVFLLFQMLTIGGPGPGR